jgi:hypothetical protein
MEISVTVSAALLSVPTSWVTPIRPIDPGTNNQNRGGSSVADGGVFGVQGKRRCDQHQHEPAPESACVAVEYGIGEER